MAIRRLGSSNPRPMTSIFLSTFTLAVLDVFVVAAGVVVA